MPRALIGCCALVAATLLLSACGGTARHIYTVSLAPPVRVTPPSPTALRFSTASNRRFARADVQKLLRILELPHGARLVTRVPRSVPLRFRNELRGTGSLPGVAVAHRLWVVHEPLDRVVRFVQAHAHPRPRPMARFRGPNNGVRLRAVGSYQFEPVPGRSWQRWLNVDMVPLSGGGTAVIGRAGDGWMHTPRRTLLPGDVKRVDVVSRVGRSPNVIVHVRKPYDVGWIVALVNGSGLADEEHIACALDYFGGPTVTLRFRAANGRVLAVATLPDALGMGLSGPCNPFGVTVDGRRASPRIGGDLLLRVKQLLGVDLAPPLPRNVSDCLQGHGWNAGMVRAQNRPPELRAAKDGRRWTITFHYTGKVTLDRPAPRGIEQCLRGGTRSGIEG